MLTYTNSVITGSGSYIPTEIVKNDDFLDKEFYNSNKIKIDKPNKEITEKLEAITGIKERRYVGEDLVTSDIAYLSAFDALESSDIDKETLDNIIVAHNFGDIRPGIRRPNFVPSIAARVKQKLGIKNPNAVAYDLVFGCPGWLQGVIHADNFIKSGNSKRALVIGAETLSRISDPYDVDSMIYSDGAGAVIIDAVESPEPFGIISHTSRSDTLEYSDMLWMDNSYDPDFKDDDLFLKMLGHKLYKYALQTVPDLIKACIDKVKLSIQDITKVFIHQANAKMDEEILKRFYNLYGIKDVLQDTIASIMPMTISWLGNSSVATLPTLFDLFMKGKLENQSASRGDIFVFASVGAGMNINAMVYKMP